MRNESQELLSSLQARLPELEWKISGLGAFFSAKSLPRGLFRAQGASACVTEIKEDIYALAQQQNERSSLYLAQRINEKINVLVTLCQLHGRKNPKEEKQSFGVRTLSTRQQWLRDLEAEVATLERQQQALVKTLEQMASHNKAEAILQLKAELGAIERQVTLAKETLTRATS